MSPEPSILLSAGEASGDLHGATLCRALRELHPGVRLIGMGGPRMAAAGMELVADVSGHAVVGTSEALGRIPRLYRAYRLLKARLIEERPRALVVIDFPEFNLRLARIARRAGVPVVYFIPPQLWAWRRGRIRQMARRVSRVLAVLPFEEQLYQDAGVPVDFVGHPLLDVLPLDLDRAEARRRLDVDPGESLIGLLPGSRREEVERLLPPMLVAAKRLSAAGVARRFALGLAPTVDGAAVGRLVKAAVDEGGPRVDVFEQRTYEVMAAADVVLISSGTATLEAALARCADGRLLPRLAGHGGRGAAPGQGALVQPAEPDREPRGRARGAPGRPHRPPARRRSAAPDRGPCRGGRPARRFRAGPGPARRARGRPESGAGGDRDGAPRRACPSWVSAVDAAHSFVHSCSPGRPRSPRGAFACSG